MRFHASHQRTVSIKMAIIVDAREVISKRLEAHLNFAARKIGNRNFERFVAAKMNYESRRGHPCSRTHGQIARRSNSSPATSQNNVD
jgi:hypothetical protein